MQVSMMNNLRSFADLKKICLLKGCRHVVLRVLVYQPHTICIAKIIQHYILVRLIAVMLLPQSTYRIISEQLF